MAKHLTKQQIRQIRKLRALGHTYKDISEVSGAALKTVARHAKDITPLGKPYVRTRDNISAEQMKEARELWASGTMTRQAIADKMGLLYSTVLRFTSDMKMAERTDTPAPLPRRAQRAYLPPSLKRQIPKEWNKLDMPVSKRDAALADKYGCSTVTIRRTRIAFGGERLRGGRHCRSTMVLSEERFLEIKDILKKVGAGGIKYLYNTVNPDEGYTTWIKVARSENYQEYRDGRLIRQTTTQTEPKPEEPIVTTWEQTGEVIIHKWKWSPKFQLFEKKTYIAKEK